MSQSQWRMYLDGKKTNNIAYFACVVRPRSYESFYSTTEAEFQTDFMVLTNNRVDNVSRKRENQIESSPKVGKRKKTTMLATVAVFRVIRIGVFPFLMTRLDGRFFHPLAVASFYLPYDSLYNSRVSFHWLARLAARFLYTSSSAKERLIHRQVMIISHPPFSLLKMTNSCSLIIKSERTKKNAIVFQVTRSAMSTAVRALFKC